MQSEFRLLAMRDADVAQSYVDFQNQFFVELSSIVVDALESVSRRFVIDPIEAIRILADLCASADQNAILAQDQRPLSERVSESLPAVLLALTETTPSTGKK